jgi:hypothetical protein
MPHICYIAKKFTPAHQEIIEKAEAICEEYMASGLNLTLRQTFYQFVARGWLPNKQTEYKRLGDILNDARMAGQLDWDFLIDRTRNLADQPHWDSPADLVTNAAKQFRPDLWEGQHQRVECLPPEQTVLTHKGYVQISEVEVGDMVLTHTGQWQPVTGTKQHWHRGDMMTVKARGCLPIRMTPNHPIWGRLHDQTRSGYKGADRKFLVDGFDFHRADAFTRFDQVLVPVPQQRRPVGWVEMSTPSGAGKRISVPWDISLRRVVGLYLAEGRVREDGRTVQFTLAENELYHRDTIVKWAGEAGVNTHEVVGGGARQVYVYSKALADWVERNFGSGAYVKRIPLWLMHAPDDEQMDVVEFYFRGDGGVDHTTSSYAATSRSRALIQSVRAMLVRSGIVAGVTQVDDHDSPRFCVKVSGAALADLQRRWGFAAPAKGLGRSQRYNYFSVVDTGMVTPIWEVTSEPYEGMVYNIEVEEDHSYVAEVAVHNCWVEKDAAIGVIERVCQENDVPFFSCRGYTSVSEMWAAGQRLRWHIEAGNQVTILHIGDHDPSGLDMSRDIEDRLRTFITGDWLGLHSVRSNGQGGITRGAIRESMRTVMRTKGSKITYDDLPWRVKRIALNQDQVETYNPPPNSAKTTDSRFQRYVDETGLDESWELDALDPFVLQSLIQDEIDAIRNEDVWSAANETMETGRATLAAVAGNWDRIAEIHKPKGLS